MYGLDERSKEAREEDAAISEARDDQGTKAFNRRDGEEQLDYNTAVKEELEDCINNLDVGQGER